MKFVRLLGKGTLRLPLKYCQSYDFCGTTEKRLYKENMKKKNKR